MDIDFYLIDGKYVDFLKTAEYSSRGFTCVPNVHYRSTEKFFYGAVMQKNGIKYFVPVSHNTTPDKNTIIITGKKRKSTEKPHVYGSLRFSYMLPVPNQMLKKLNISEIGNAERKRAVSDELAFCRRNKDKIAQKAEKTYNLIISANNSKAINNCCDFKLLERACIEFCKLNNLDIPFVKNESVQSRENDIMPTADTEKQQLTERAEKAEARVNAAEARAAAAEDRAEKAEKAFNIVYEENEYRKGTIRRTNQVLNAHPEIKKAFVNALKEIPKPDENKDKTHNTSHKPHKPKR